MTRMLATACLVGVAPILFCAAARGEPAAEAFAKGKQLLTEGDFNGALAAHADAVRADRQNRQYLDRYAMLRRVVQLRKSLEQEQDPARWEAMAKALQSFYVGERLHSQALSLGRQVHMKLANQWSAVSLAEIQLALDLNDEAAATLSALEPGKSSPVSSALLGIALARQRQADRAKQIAESIALGNDAEPQALYAAARLSAAVGDSAGALKLLARCLQSVSPSRQPGYRENAVASPEFAAIAGGPEFAKALATASKVPESKCSGGTSCAGCPMRGKCAGSQ